MKRKIAFAGIFLSLSVLTTVCVPAVFSADQISLSAEDYSYVQKMIFQHECAGDKSKMLAWNEGENFPSLGIGHFIWYTKAGGAERFQELFPKFIAYLEKHGQKVPAWIKKLPDKRAPWATREEFLRAAKANGPRITSLRSLLTRTLVLQAKFIVRRTQRFLPRILKQVPVSERKDICRKFELLASTKEGLYAIIDYAHFKGDGLDAAERYKGQGWGLYQVLQEMRQPDSASTALWEFNRAAKKVIERRVANSPPARGEKRWLPGWENRLDSYTVPLSDS